MLSHHFSDGICDIFQRVRPSFVFCDSDIVESIKDIIRDIGLNVKIFTVNETVDGFDSIDVLMKETGNEDSFVYVVRDFDCQTPTIIVFSKNQ